MKKFVIFIFIILLCMPMKSSAQGGCCSHHGGVAGCSSSGRQICKDGTLSPTCTCTPPVTYIYGCTDPEAKNYNVNAEKDDSSCEYDIEIEEQVLSPTVSNESNISEEESSDDSSGIFYLIGGGALATYLYKRKKKKQ